MGEEHRLTAVPAPPSIDHVIRLDDVSVSFPCDDGTRRLVLNNLDLHVRRGELVTLVGPSGCGKSTLLRLILGAARPTSGSVRVNGEPVLGLSRDRGIVFQQYSLFPHLRVFENVSIGPVLDQTSLVERYLLLPSFFRKRAIARERSREYIRRIGFDAGDADKFPYELSGGMRQRVAIAQAMIMEPQVLLMDEPFGALDFNTRTEMQLFLLEQWKEHGTTIIFVTHDLDEACYLGTRVIGLSQYWVTDDDKPGAGALICTDVRTPGAHPKPSTIRTAVEFTDLVQRVGRDVLDPENRRRLAQFNLTHQDAAPAVPVLQGSTGGSDG
jgi:NitT/TauT family transport system ATP-binding protein